jgi:ribonuclease HI
MLKTLEKILVTKLLPEIDRIDADQYAYRRNRSTIQALNDSITIIEDNMNKKKVTLAGFFDIEGAFDNIRYDRICQIMREKFSIDERIIKWTFTMLNYRSVEINLFQNCKKLSPTSGTPQGGVLSCHLWNFYVNDLIRKLKQINYVKVKAYADDLLVLCESNYKINAIDRMHLCLDLMDNWCETNGLAINPKKAELMCFTKIKKLRIEQLKFKDVVMKTVNSVKYLGLHIDSKLDYKIHIKNVKTRIDKTIFMIRKFSQLTWGLSINTLILLYKAIILPRITYACCIWYHKSLKGENLNNIKNIQSTILRRLAFSIGSTPHLAIVTALNIPFLADEIKNRTILDILRLGNIGQWDYDSYNDHTSANHLSEVQQFKHNYDVIFNIRRICRADVRIPKLETWLNGEFSLIDSDFDHVNNPLAEQIEIYTDASVEPERTGIGIYSEALEIREAFQYDIKMSTYKAELIALNKALHIVHNLNLINKHFFFFCDNEGVCRALKRKITNSQLLQKTFQITRNIEEKHNIVTFVWIPSHRQGESEFFKHNEEADVLSKDKNAQFSPILSQSPFTKNEVKQILRNNALNKVQATWVRNPDECIASKKMGLDKLHTTRIKPFKFTKTKFFLFISFITGHNFLGKHMRHIAKPGSVVVNDGRCRFCSEGSLESSLHLLEECNGFMIERIKIFKKCRISTSDRSFSLERCIKFINCHRIRKILLRYDHKLDLTEFANLPT